MGILQSEQSDLSWLPYVSLLIVDEVHKLRRDNKVNKIIKKIRTPHKFGFTGTMPTDMLDQWNIIGKIGPILYKRMAYQLRADNYVAQSRVLILELIYNSTPDYNYNDAADSANYMAEMEFLIKNDFRNRTITRLAQNFKNNALIMVDRIEHGETLFHFLSQHLVNKQIFFIQGDVEVEERKRVQDLMETSDNVVCIAISKIFSTGINIKNLHYIVFAAGGKAKVKIVQSIGRGLRLHASKNILTVIDIADVLQYGIKHLKERKQLYETEKITFTTKQIHE
jgi:superfamily II DNA or RNA helicase